MCIEEELMEQEQQFLQALEAVNTFEISQNTLTLRQDDSTMVNFAVSE